MRRVVVIHTGRRDDVALDWGIEMQRSDESVQLVVLHKHHLAVGYIGAPPASARRALAEAGVECIHDRVLDLGADPDRTFTVSSGRTVEQQFADFGGDASVVLIGDDPAPRWRRGKRRSERLKMEFGVPVLVAGVDRSDAVPASAVASLEAAWQMAAATGHPAGSALAHPTATWTRVEGGGDVDHLEPAD